MQAPVPPAEAQSRRLYFLDWIRILAFFVLIAYHIGMYYVSWDWHVKSPYAGPAPEPFMMLSSPWRLTLLFFVSGVASRFLFDRLGAPRFLRQRSLRLLLPLLFGMAVVVPPQPYFEVVEKLGYEGGFAAFLRLYFSADGGFCREECLDLPTWNHLWFVAYLWVYTMLLVALTSLAGRLPMARRATWVAGIVRRLAGWKLLVLPAAVLGLARILLAERFPSTHGLVDDWYNHAAYFLPFLLGAVIARSTPFWEHMMALRWPALGLALTSWALVVLWNAAPDGVMDADAVSLFRPAMRCVYTLCAWSAIVAVCGFGRRHLDRDGPARRYLTEAVFPVYILHQTLIVVLAHLVKPIHLAPGLEALLLAVLTLGGCFAVFEVVRRIALLRPFFGLAPRRTVLSAAASQRHAVPDDTRSASSSGISG